MPKTYFFDIDNTLLNHDDFTIPHSAQQAIQRLKHDGHTVVIATGRGLGHARAYIDQIQPHFSITQNGARVYRGDTEIDAQVLDREALPRLFDFLDASGHVYGINDGHSGHVNRLTPLCIEPMQSVNMPQFDDAREFFAHNTVYQGWMFFHETLDATLMPQLRAQFPMFDYVRWHTTALDILPHGVNKWTAVQTVLSVLGHSADKAVAFGDGLNDIEMLQGVGLGIAMGNAHPQVKAIADQIAPHLNEHGIAKALSALHPEWGDAVWQ